jgi:lipoprotein-anchoring transpeptidase ErfK/SrfK
VTSSSAGIYARPTNERSFKIGYARNGGRIPVLRDKVPGEGCREGWYEGAEGGFICSAEGTIDDSDPHARLSATPPDLTSVLPYPYARNGRNGTPLFSSVPSVDQIQAYEPHAGGDTPSKAAWWQRDRVQLSQVKLAELASESDGLLAKRLVRGFYVAVDREFEWDNRTWYKTTKGMVTPKDRYVAVQGYDFHGVELTEDHGLPVAWAFGSRATRPRYRLGANGAPSTLPSTIAHHQPIYLTGVRQVAANHIYLETIDHDWVQSDHVRVASLPIPPANLTENERWIFVDLDTQTLVALEGARPVYATLISSGKESDEPANDHRTPRGEWFIREKHIATTMDGDGTAAGDLPYSIEDVPYVMYFQGSYALHGAFWHRNFGTRMSHGCVNLAPLDAKYLFFFTDPPVRSGWHGAWAGNGTKGTRVVIQGASKAS